MKNVTVINRLSVKPGMIDRLVEAQRAFGASMTAKRCGLIGGRLYRGVDGDSVVLVSQFESKAAQDAIRQMPEFAEHLRALAPLVESSSPALYEEAYTTGDFA